MISKQGLPCFIAAKDCEQAISLELVPEKNFETWLDKQESQISHWVIANGFNAKPFSFCTIPNADGSIQKIIVGTEEKTNTWSLAHLPLKLPEAHYQVIIDDGAQWQDLALGWGLASYQFKAFKPTELRPATLVIPKTEDSQFIQSQLQAFYLVRDLINSPAETMGPAQLSIAAEALAQHYDAEFNAIVGDELLQKHYPAIHAVGRASNRQPRLLDLRWGKQHKTKITLVGKGVCFDSGGLNIKTGSGMKLMKKDMGGAAHALGLASLIMDANLPIQLRVLIPAVDNVISGGAYKPGDIILTRKGLSVEIGNTDAEGRVVLADALYEASLDKPDLIIDFATLTGAARVALGPDIPVLFSNKTELTQKLLTASENVDELIWSLPLYKPYEKWIDSNIADVNNNSKQPYGGAITAALFLQKFVDNTPWMHLDLMAWNLEDKPGRPQGGEAMGLRAVFEFIKGYLF